MLTYSMNNKTDRNAAQKNIIPLKRLLIGQNIIDRLIILVGLSQNSQKKY